MKLKITSFFLAVFLSFLFFPSKAQNGSFDFFRGNEAWVAGINVGVNSFWGDVTDNSNHIFPSGPFQASFYKNRNLVIGGFFGKRLSPAWAVSLDFKLANVKGHNYNTGERFFSKFNQEYVLTTTFDILTLAGLYTNWTFYPRFGLGIYGHRLVNTYTFNFTIPFGLGFGYKPLPELHLFFETSMSWVAGDMLDGVKPGERSFEGVWTTSVGVSYQFDFPSVTAGRRGIKAYDGALKGDNVNKQYNRQKRRSNLPKWNGKPRTNSKSTFKGKAKDQRKRQQQYH